MGDSFGNAGHDVSEWDMDGPNTAVVRVEVKVNAVSGEVGEFSDKVVEIHLLLLEIGVGGE